MTKTENTEKGFVRITPEEGMCLTDGTTVSTLVYCPTAKTDRWTEITLEEGEELKARQEEQEAETLRLQEPEE